MTDHNKLTIKTKERAKQLNELTNELVAASLFDSNLFQLFSIADRERMDFSKPIKKFRLCYLLHSHATGFFSSNVRRTWRS